MDFMTRLEHRAPAQLDHFNVVLGCYDSQNIFIFQLYELGIYSGNSLFFKYILPFPLTVS